jgi:hypothetical protein
MALGRDEVRESNSILMRREASRCYIESNYELLRQKYEGKEVVAVTTDTGTEVAAAYDPDSENNWCQALSAIEEIYGEETYHSSVARELEK